MTADLMLRGGRVIDPANGVDGVATVLIQDGIVQAVEPEETGHKAATRVIDVSGMLVFPGVIDPHMHLNAHTSGRKLGLYMLARAGVTTAVDFGGPFDDVAECVRTYGAGLDIASLNPVKPGHSVSMNPSRSEFESFAAQALESGALGIKIFGTNYPLSPESTRDALEVANEAGAYVAFHSGTRDEPRNDLAGFIQSVELSHGLSVHIPHVSSYLRGTSKAVIDETSEALNLLVANPNIVSESYLATYNGLWAKVTDEAFEGKSVYNSLRLGGYEESVDGFKQAVRDGFGMVHIPIGDEYVLTAGEEALEYWRERRTDTGVSFHVVPALSGFCCAVSKRQDGQFVVDALCSDGGEMPRNFMVERGMALCRLGAIRIEELVRKLSTNAARMFGMHNKGHLSPGADGDITVVDPENGRPCLAIARGRVIMCDGVVVGSGGRLLVSSDGRKKAECHGLPVEVIDTHGGTFFRGRSEG